MRTYQPADLETLQHLTVAAFEGVTLEQNVESALGILNGHDWKWRKARHVDDDVAADPGGIFVAETAGQIAGYISTRRDQAAGKGRIPNLVVAEPFRGQGLGRLLIDHALAYFRQEGLAYAVIETMAQNEIGNHLYRSCGFLEVARQVHFALRLQPQQEHEA
ncbi:MAG: GNAT family N-acetyltransferase [Planctomycetaceae bacterium]